ncbi:tRNA wybutosine-synthesizing protein 3-like [Acipenser ruthenus]|uniref:tRNA wybutosine-synthesizing protein 3 homolog n=1 Tax=Acipenser ruthenus TaxID=7906 RepID=A0A444U3Z5_ACIRT|nr:tRNA wybutosine-synthesizing protein 3-like [Acipenser ruthenus]
MEAGNNFKQWKKQCLSKVDFSKKGSVDEDIKNIVSFINDCHNYFTTSSCSGRIILINGLAGLRKACGDAVFKFEPFVLHVQCKQLEDAQLLAVRSTHCLEVPLSHKGQVLVQEEYIDYVVQVANQKIEENQKRIERLVERHASNKIGNLE